METVGLFAGLDRVARNWGWYLLLGLALAIIGLAAALYPLAATGASLLFLGYFLVFSGIIQCLISFQCRGWQGFFLHLLAGILELVCGVLMLANPLAAAVTLTLLLAAFLIIGGLFRMIGAFAMKFPGSGWIALSGFVSFLLGLAVLNQWPASGLWFIGLCVGVDLLLHGATWIAFAMRLKTFHHREVARAG
jgi:uncharacterized membrane protein HdeD (DUF308 family)